MTEKEYVDRSSELSERRERMIVDMMDLNEEFVRSLPFRIGDYVEVKGGITRKHRAGWIGFITPEVRSGEAVVKLELFIPDKDGARTRRSACVYNVRIGDVTVLKGGDYVGE